MNDWARLATMRRCLGAFGDTYGDREKVVFPDADPPVRWTASAFDRETNRVAAGYLALGLEPGDRVGLVGRNTPELVTAFYGAAKAGVVPCCFNPRESTGRLATLGARYGAAALVYDPRLAAVAEAVMEDADPDALVELPGGTVPAVEPTLSFEAMTSAAGASAQPFDTPPAVEVGRDDPAFVNWSTGTTGVPKGLEWTNDGAVAAGVINVHARGLTHDDVRINYSSPGFIGWFYATFPAFVAGATLVFMERFEPERYLELIERERATEFGGVSTPVRMALDAGPADYDLSSVRSAYYVGEPMARETIERIEAAVTPNVAALYGTTEATGLTALGSGSDDPTALAAHLPLVEARAVEVRDGGQLVPPERQVPIGGTGELVIRTPGRAARVIGDPELTEAIFRDGWWYSGDVVERRPDGTYRIVGRTDDMIVTGGINVFPSLVEEVVADHPAVEEVVVLGLPDDEWGQRVVAAVRFRPKQAADADALEAHCLGDDRLPRHARPREYFPLGDDGSVPRTPTGKLYRAELADRLERRRGERPTG